MKKIIVSAFALTMLGSSAVFADSSKLSAFQNVETAAVSASELNQVSGEGLLDGLLGTSIGGVLNQVLGTVTGLTQLGLLKGVAVSSTTQINTPALVNGLLGINQATVGVQVR